MEVTNRTHNLTKRFGEQEFEGLGYQACSCGIHVQRRSSLCYLSFSLWGMLWPESSQCHWSYSYSL